MEFNYFNRFIDYKGEDLHMLRNDKLFLLNKFFNTSEHTALYKFRLKGDYSVTNLDGISITSNNEIIAIPYANPADAEIECFFVEVTINNQTAVILIHLHDSLADVWMSPN